MSEVVKKVIEIYVEFSEVGENIRYFIPWTVGWLYMGRIKFRCEEEKCGGCVWLKCGTFELFNLWKIKIEDDINMFDLAMSFGLDVMRMSKEYDPKIKIGICSNNECIDVNLDDIEKWWDEEVLSYGRSYE
jgi:hypothetical protein